MKMKYIVTTTLIKEIKTHTAKEKNIKEENLLITVV